jgi:hypothetical protein
MLDEGLGSGEVGERSKGGEGVANAQKELAVAKAPEVLGMVVQMPRGAGEDAAGGKFDQNGVDNAVLIVVGFVGETGNEAVDDEGDEKVLVVDVVQGEHGAAVEQELGREWLVAEVFEREPKRWLCAAGKEGDGEEKKKPAQGCATWAMRCRDG